MSLNFQNVFSDVASYINPFLPGIGLVDVVFRNVDLDGRRIRLGRTSQAAKKVLSDNSLSSIPPLREEKKKKISDFCKKQASANSYHLLASTLKLVGTVAAAVYVHPGFFVGLLDVAPHLYYSMACMRKPFYRYNETDKSFIWTDSTPLILRENDSLNRIPLKGSVIKGNENGQKVVENRRSLMLNFGK